MHMLHHKAGWSRVAGFVGALLLLAPLPSFAAGWAGLSSGSTADFYGISMSGDGGYGIAVGPTGSARRTSDSGKTWTSSPIGTSSHNDVSFAPGLQTAWAVDSNGKVRKTTDAGGTWEAAVTVTSTALRAVHALDGMKVWVAGGKAGIYTSTNGGSTWTAKHLGTKTLWDIFFVDATYGWAVGADGTIRRTKNGGNSWLNYDTGTNTYWGVHFVDPNKGFMVGSNRTVLKSIDGGVSWSAVGAASLDSLNVSSETTFFAVRFWDLNNGMIAGDGGLILQTSDAGMNWTKLTSGTTNTVRSFHGTPVTAMYAAGLNGVILRYDNIPPQSPGSTGLSTGGNLTNDSTPTFTWAAPVENETSVKDYRVYIDEISEYGNPITTATSWTATAPIPDGTHVFEVTAVDAGNNTSTASLFTFTVDATPPTVSALSANPTSITEDVAVTFSATVSDGTSPGISSCSLFVDGASQGTAAVTGGVASRSHTFATGGSFSVKIDCTDVAGNVGSSPTFTASVTGSTPPADTTPSGSTSQISVVPSSVSANNIATASVTVTVKNAGGTALSGKSVSLTSSRPSTDTIIASSPTTNSSGQATFTVKSSAVGSSTLTAMADAVTLGTTSVSFTTPGSCPHTIGTLVKLPDDGDLNTQIDSAVYYYGADCKRHAFSNSKVYFTWYADFNSVTVVQSSVLASMTLGKNVTYRPGVRMVKFTTVNNVYAVSKGGVLRWVKTEPIAISLYGATWNTKIDDISDAFYTNYLFGSDVNAASDYNASAEMNGAVTIDESL